MPAPLYDFLIEKAKKKGLRFHMPGHKGKSFLGVSPELIDFTELSDTGNLYSCADDPIRAAETLAAKDYGAESCLFCTGGSTLGIQSVLGALAVKKCEPLKILAARDAHMAFFNALALVGAEADFINCEYNATFDITCGISPELVENALKARNYDAFYCTSPNYYGALCDIEKIAEVCRRRGVPLIVDAAHGAHLAFLDKKLSPAFLGADFTVISAHKTLPALGQAALVLAKAEKAADIRRAMRIFGTSSPSYAVMASTDLALSEMRVGKIHETATKTYEFIQYTNKCTAFCALTSEDLPYGTDPCRLTVLAASAGISGYDLSARLEAEYGIEAEMADDRNVVFIFTISDGEREFSALKSALFEISAKLEKTEVAAGEGLPSLPKRKLSPREALFRESELVPLGKAEDRIVAEILAPYPPGIPVVAPGEKISRSHISFLVKKRYNADEKIVVIKALDS